jgi:MFS transporter, SP family, inositol transporter
MLVGMGAAFSGETIYKVWSQEMVPTLLRSTAQGVTIAFARITAALFALSVVSGLMGLFWITRLPKARELEPEEAILVHKADAVPGQGSVATSGT